MVTNQYESLGVIFNTGVLQIGGPGLVSAPNVLTNAAAGIGIIFTGDLPTFVSVYVSAINEDSVYIDAFGPAGYLSSVVTDGWRGTEEDSTPYRDKQLVTFKGAEISHLSLTPNFIRRNSLHIDDLSFTRGALGIPEPSALGLVAGGLALLFGIRRRSEI